MNLPRVRIEAFRPANADHRFKPASSAALAALAVGCIALAAPRPVEAQWETLLNSGIRALQQQQELEFRREQEERRRQEEERHRQEEERRRQEELQRQERYRQPPPVRWEPPRQPNRYQQEPSNRPDSSEVAQIQRLLNEQGYDAGPVDGAMGSRTREAIRAFERDFGLPQTGEPSREIARRLLRGAPPAPGSAGSPIQPWQSADADRSQTAEIQRLLNARGYDAGPVDGVMGARTREAIRAYQIGRGLPPTGEPSAALVQSLRDDAPSAVGFGSGVPGGTPGGSDANIAPAPVPPGLTTRHDRVLLVGNRPPREIAIDADALARVTARLMASSLPGLIEQSNATLLDLMKLLEPHERRAIYLDAVQHRDRPVPGRYIGDTTLFEQLERQGWLVTAENLPNFGVTPFEQERLAEIFRLRGLPEVVSQSPALPIPVVVLCEAHLSDYDPQRQMFDLHREVAGCGVGQIPSLVRNVGLTAELPTDAFRPEFRIEPSEAEKLFLSLPARHSGQSRTVVLAVEALLEGLTARPAPAAPGAILQLRTVGAALYADGTLEGEIHRFPATQQPGTSGVEPPGDPAAVANAEALARSQGKPLVAGRVLLEGNAYQLREQAVDLTAPALWRVFQNARELMEGRELRLFDLLEQAKRAELLRAEVLQNVDSQRQKSALDLLAKNGWSYSGGASFLQMSGYTEFDEARLEERLRTQVLPSAMETGRLATPLPVLIGCQLGLGEYNLDRQSFGLHGDPAHCADLRLGTNKIAEFSGRVDLTGVPPTLSMPAEEAEQFVQSLDEGKRRSYGRDREVLLGVEALLTGVTASVSDRGGRIGVRLSFETTGAAYYRDGESWSLVRRIDLNRPLPDPAEQAPQRLSLDDGDTLTLLMLRHGLLEPDEELWRKMMNAQANRQGNDRSGTGWNHYPGPLGPEGPYADFAEWMRQRAAALPDAFVLKGQHTLEPEFAGESGIRLLDAISPHNDIGRSVAAAVAIRPDFLLANNVSNRWWAPDAARIFVLALPAPRSSYTVPLPVAGTAEGRRFDSELVLRIAGAQVVADDRGRRVLVVEAVPLSAKVFAGGHESERTFDADAHLPTAEGRSVPRIPFPDTEWLVLEQARLDGKANEAGMHEALAATSFGRSLDEFTIREEAAALLQRAQAAPPPEPGAIWTVGKITLGTYDFTLQHFPVSSLTLGAVPEPSTDLAEQLASRIRFEVANLEKLNVAMPPDAAKAWMSANSNHPYYPARARGRIVGTRGGGIRLELLEVDLLAKNAIASLDDPGAVVHEIMLEAPAASAVKVVPPASMPLEAPADTTTLSTDAIEVEPGRLDIIELRLGDSFEDAVAKAESDVELAVRVDTELAQLVGSPVPTWSAFRTITSIRSADRSQVIVLHRAPPIVARKLTGIARVVTFGPDRRFPAASVKELLIDKYGEPREAAERYMVWLSETPGDNTSAEEIRACMHGIQGRAMDIMVSLELNDPAEAAQVALFDIFGDTDMPAIPQCGEMLVAVLRTDPDGQVEQLITTLGDPSLYADIERAGQAAAASVAETVKPKIKL